MVGEAGVEGAGLGRVGVGVGAALEGFAGLVATGVGDAEVSAVGIEADEDVTEVVADAAVVDVVVVAAFDAVVDGVVVGAAVVVIASVDSVLAIV